MLDDLSYWFFRKKMDARWWIRKTMVMLTQRAGVEFWNWDKPHRCPECHTIVTDGGARDLRDTWNALYECCRCGTLFARWPRLATDLRQCQDIATGECPWQRSRE